MKKTITEFNKTTLPELRKALDEALAKIAAEFGLDQLKLGNMTYTPGGATFGSKLEGKVKAETNAALMEENLRNSEVLGYEANIVGEIFTLKGERFKVTGIDLNRTKMPITAQSLSDNRLVKVGATVPLRTDKIIGWSNKNVELFK